MEPFYTDPADERPFKHKKKRPPKEFFCAKNKIGPKQYGPHQYDEKGRSCVRCGHIRKGPRPNPDGALKNFETAKLLKTTI